MKVDYASYQRLRAMLDQFRDQFLTQGVPMLSAYVPSAEQTARELAGIRERNNRRGQPSAAARAAAFAAEPTAPAQAPPPSTAPAPTAPSASGPSGTATPPAPPAGTTTTPRPSGPVTVTRPQDSATKEFEAPSKAPVGNDARSGGTFSDPAYGTREWFDFLVRTRESYQFREGFRIGMPEASIRESVDKRVRQNSPAMFDRAWKLANELLSSKKVEDKDTAIRIAAILTYQKYYPPDAVADAQPGGETRAEIAVADYKARQILAGQGPVSRFFEALLLPASVNPQPLNLDNLLMATGGMAGVIRPGRGLNSSAQVRKPGSRGNGSPRKKPSGKMEDDSRSKQRPKPRPAPDKKPIDKSRRQHGNVTHDATAYNTGKAWEADKATVEVRFNQELVDTHGNKYPELRPDVQRIRRTSSGKLVVDVLEIKSPSQSAPQMDAKKARYYEILGGQSGVIDWKEPSDAARNKHL